MVEAEDGFYDDFELIAYLSNRLDLSKGLERAPSRLSVVCQVMMHICRCKIDNLSKSASHVSTLDGSLQAAQAYTLCVDLDVRAQQFSNQLLTPSSSFGVTHALGSPLLRVKQPQPRAMVGNGNRERLGPSQIIGYYRLP